jgi:hypothetical protein
MGTLIYHGSFLLNIYHKFRYTLYNQTWWLVEQEGILWWPMVSGLPADR